MTVRMMAIMPARERVCLVIAVESYRGGAIPSLAPKIVPCFDPFV